MAATVSLALATAGVTSSLPLLVRFCAAGGDCATGSAPRAFTAGLSSAALALSSLARTALGDPGSCVGTSMGAVTSLLLELELELDSTVDAGGCGCCGG